MYRCMHTYIFNAFIYGYIRKKVSSNFYMAIYIYVHIYIYIGKEMTALRMKIDDLEKARVELVIELGNTYVYVYVCMYVCIDV
jgi:5-methylcytosine-specific restriction endonuclease McrBC regulatory subunit McrC